MALAAAEEGFYIWNIKTGVIHYTDRLPDHDGGQPQGEGPQYFHPAGAYHPRGGPGLFSQEVRRYLDGHSHMPMRIEIRMKKLNSSWSWVRINGLARRTKRRPVMLVGVWVNITRRKTAELYDGGGQGPVPHPD
ncbi:MAG: hypothetical protein ACLT8E_06470 [Akkermansia sp.]